MPFKASPTPTDRELQVLHWLHEGLSMREVAHELGLAEQTAKNLSVNAYRRLGVHNKIAAFRALGWR